MEKAIEVLASTLGIPLTAVIVTALGMVAVYLFVSNKVKKQKSESDASLDEIIKKAAVLEQRVFTCEKRLDEGNDKFNSMDVTLRSINSSIERLTGMVEMFFRSQGLGGNK